MLKIQVSLKNEKVEHQIKMKTYCLKVLDWKWCQSLMCGLDSCYIGVVSPGDSLSKDPTVVSELKVRISKESVYRKSS